jgi:lysozyme
MTLNANGIDLMHQFEGLKLEAYLCPAKVPTIGYGNTFYENGTKVKMGDKITKARADELFINITNRVFADPIRKMFPKGNLRPNQFSALVCFAYNVGVGNLQKSTLLIKALSNPNDPTIRNEFMKWNRAGGKELPGLTRRRKAEADLYFKA